MDTSHSTAVVARDPAPRAEPPQPACLFCQAPMKLWMEVPADCKKGSPNRHAGVHRCDQCRYAAVHPMPSAAEVTEFYRIPDYYTHGISEPPPSAPPSLLDRVRVHLAWRLDRGTPTSAALIDAALGGRPSTICDVGCGGGNLARALGELGHRVTGVEVDTDAASFRGGSFEIHAGTAEDLPRAVSERRFDCVVLCHVLEHCRDPLRALRNARGLLAPGGKLVCEVPNNAAAALDQAGCTWEMFDVPRHLHFFTRESLEQACVLAGLRVGSVHYGYYTRQFTNDWIGWEQALWDNLKQVGTAARPSPPRNSRLRAWRLLAETFAAAPARKYDSVGVIATP